MKILKILLSLQGKKYRLVSYTKHYLKTLDMHETFIVNDHILNALAFINSIGKMY